MRMPETVRDMTNPELEPEADDTGDERIAADELLQHRVLESREFRGSCASKGCGCYRRPTQDP